MIILLKFKTFIIVLILPFLSFSLFFYIKQTQLEGLMLILSKELLPFIW